MTSRRKLDVGLVIVAFAAAGLLLLLGTFADEPSTEPATTAPTTQSENPVTSQGTFSNYNPANHALYHFLGYAWSDMCNASAPAGEHKVCNNKSDWSLNTSCAATLDGASSQNDRLISYSNFRLSERFGTIFGQMAATTSGTLTTSVNANATCNNKPGTRYNFTLNNYPLSIDTSTLPDEILDIIAKPSLDNTDRARLRAFVISVTEGEGSRFGLLLDDPSEDAVRAYIRVLHKLGFTSLETWHNNDQEKIPFTIGTNPDGSADFSEFDALASGKQFYKLMLTDSTRQAEMASWNFGGYHRVPGCGSNALFIQCTGQHAVTGDANGDRTTDISDATQLIDLWGQQLRADQSAADLNLDGTIDVNDIQLVIEGLNQ